MLVADRNHRPFKSPVKKGPGNPSCVLRWYQQIENIDFLPNGGIWENLGYPTSQGLSLRALRSCTRASWSLVLGPSVLEGREMGSITTCDGCTELSILAQGTHEKKLEDYHPGTYTLLEASRTG